MTAQRITFPNAYVDGDTIVGDGGVSNPLRAPGLTLSPATNPAVPPGVVAEPGALLTDPTTSLMYMAIGPTPTDWAVVAGTGAAGIVGPGTVNTVAKFTGPAAVGDSSITDDGVTISLGPKISITEADGTTILGGNGYAPQGQHWLKAPNGLAVINTGFVSPNSGDKNWFDFGVTTNIDATLIPALQLGLSIDLVANNVAGANPITAKAFYSSCVGAGAVDRVSGHFAGGRFQVDGPASFSDAVNVPVGTDMDAAIHTELSGAGRSAQPQYYAAKCVAGGSCNATALPRANFGAYGEASASRSAGANNVTNYGVYGTAINGQVNYSGFFDLGDFQVNGNAVFSSEIFAAGNPTSLNAFNNVSICSGGGAKTLAFFGAAGSAQPVIAGSRAGNAALADLLAKLATMGLIVDNTTP